MEVKENIYIDTLGTAMLAYTMGMDEGTRPSDDVVYEKWVKLLDKCKNVEGFAKNIKTPFEKGFIKSVVMASGLPWQKQDKELEYVIFVNPFTYNLCFSRGLYYDDVLYVLPLKKDGIFGLPQETIGCCYSYTDFLSKSDEEIEKDCTVRREEILKREHIKEEEKTGETEGQS